MQLLSASTRDPTNLAALSDRYRTSALCSVQIDNFLADDVAAAVSEFLLEEARFDDVYGVQSVKGHATDVTTWTAAPEEDRLFYNEMLAGTGANGTSKNLLTFLILRNFLSSAEFCGMVSELTELPLPSAFTPRVHSFRQGHYLRAHHDRAKSRRIAYILYLTPGWQPEFGGQLTMVTGDHDRSTFEPRHNSLLLFDVYRQKEHYIAPILPAAGERPRLTMSAWLNCEQDP